MADETPVAAIESTELPNGIDRADGLLSRPGTDYPTESLLWQSSAGAGEVSFEEDPDSPEIERAEQGTITHSFICSYAEAVARIQFYGRGTVLKDSDDNYSRVLSAKIQHQKGGSAKLIVVAESLSFDSPPDDFDVSATELGLSILKHPRYWTAFVGEGYGSATEKQNQCVIRLLQDYFANTNYSFRQSIEYILANSMDYVGSSDLTDDHEISASSTGRYFGTGKIPGTMAAKIAALEIVEKYWRGEETPYIVGWQVTWSQYFFRPPYLHPGGILQSPQAGGLPAYFYSPTNSGDPSVSMFDGMSFYNPQCYSTDGTKGGTPSISWLRKADQISYSRTWFKVDHIWCGSPIGHWDRDIYNENDRPQNWWDFDTGVDIYEWWVAHETAAIDALAAAAGL